ncbi:MAG: imidazole glycerol phosphate synthase subunit HisH [Coriobacteriia bacterium]
MIAIIDYGMGNLRSVEKGFHRAGAEDASVTDRADDVRRADGLVLPGVGAFRDAVSNLRSGGMADIVVERAREGVPLLGICLGMQLLVTKSYEDGEWDGLDLVPGTCERLPDGVKVPHIGWNTVEYPNPSPLFEGVQEGSAFYFVHSYAVRPRDESAIIGLTEYGAPFAASVQNGNVFGVQFHPEKSSAVGIRVLRNFAGLVGA